MVDQVRLAARAREDLVGFIGISSIAYIGAFAKAFLFDQYGYSLFSDWSAHEIPFLDRLFANVSLFGLLMLPVYSLISGGLFGFITSYILVLYIEAPETHPFEQFGEREALQIRRIKTTIALLVFLASLVLTFLIPYVVFKLFFL